MVAAFGRFAGVVGIGLVLLAQPALAQDAKDKSGDTCDALAANPLDANVPEGTGVDFFSVDTAAAIPACLAAIEADPTDTKRRYQLARAYDVAEQFDEAIANYEAAGDMGYGMAVNALGSLYEGGYGVEVDLTRAAALYQQAAEAGTAVAMENLAKLYEDGRGVEQDYDRAVTLYRQAADKGSTYAMASLGWLTENGLGVPQDAVEAVRLYQIAADDGVDFALNNIGAMYAKGIGGLEKNEAEAIRYYTLAAEQGYALAYNNLAWHYSHGAGVERDVAVAEDYLRRAIAEGNEKVQGDARNDLAWLFAIEGKQLDEAEELARQAVEAGPEEANRLDTLGWILHLTDRNEEALPLLEKAVALDGTDTVYAEHLAAINSALGK